MCVVFNIFIQEKYTTRSETEVKVIDQARRRGGGVGGGGPTPQLPIPKILFHPLAILFHPLAILFHPLAILFHPWNMWQCPRGGGVLVNVQEGGVFQFFGGRMTSRGQCPRGGGACECPRVGAFFKLMTSRGQCPRGGGCAWCSTHPSSDLAGWLRACRYCDIVITECEMIILYTMTLAILYILILHNQVTKLS